MKLKNIDLKTIEQVRHIADGKTEMLLIKVRGRGWFLSTGPTSEKHCTPSRMKRWIVDDLSDFVQVKVSHFSFEFKGVAK